MDVIIWLLIPFALLIEGLLLYDWCPKAPGLIILFPNLTGFGDQVFHDWAKVWVVSPQVGRTLKHALSVVYTYIDPCLVSTESFANKWSSWYSVDNSRDLTIDCDWCPIWEGSVLVLPTSSWVVLRPAHLEWKLRGRCIIKLVFKTRERPYWW